MRLARLISFFCLMVAGALSFMVLVGCSAQPNPTLAPSAVDAHGNASGAAVAGAVDEANRSRRRIIRVGEVRVVDELKRFVLIDLQSNLYLPEPGVILRAMRETTETAKLKVSQERMRPFIAADIIGGDPAPGDQVVQ